TGRQRPSATSRRTSVSRSPASRRARSSLARTWCASSSTRWRRGGCARWCKPRARARRIAPLQRAAAFLRPAPVAEVVRELAEGDHGDEHEPDDEHGEDDLLALLGRVGHEPDGPQHRARLYTTR